MPSGPRWSSGRATACLPSPSWMVSAGRFKASTGSAGSPLPGARDDAPSSRRARSVEGEASRMTAAASSSPAAIGPGAPALRSPHPARGLRPHDRGDRPRFPHPRAHAGSSHRARQAKIRDAAHSLRGAVPGRAADRPGQRPARHLSRLQRGYSASSGASLTRHDLAEEATVSGGSCSSYCPSPMHGLLALMLLHESRRAARTSPTGET